MTKNFIAVVLAAIALTTMAEEPSEQWIVDDTGDIIVWQVVCPFDLSLPCEMVEWGDK